MISQDDIDAFQADNGPALRAAAEFARRSRKGIPSDRWADGTAGARLVAEGIAAQQAVIVMLTQTIVEMSAAGLEAGRISMGLGNGDS